MQGGEGRDDGPLDCLFAQRLHVSVRLWSWHPFAPWREASRSRPEGEGTPRRMRHTLRGSDDRERGLARRSRRRGEQLNRTGERERADAMLIATALVSAWPTHCPLIKVN